MPTIKILYDVDGWAYHNRALALRKYAPDDFEVSIGRLPRGGDSVAALGDREVDLVFVLVLSEVPVVGRTLRSRGWRSKLVGSWNSGWPLQTVEFYGAHAVADAVVINNLTAWERVGRLPRTVMLPNGVDLDLFRVRVPVAERTPKVLWVGSRRGRHRKGYDELIVPLQQILCGLRIDCETLLVDAYGDHKRTPPEMAEWYNTGTVLVCASAIEGTPNPALEAAACGCTVVSTAVGNMPEFIRHGVNGYLVERNLDALVEAVRSASDVHPRLATEIGRDIRSWSWKDRSAEYYAAFRAVLGVDECSQRTSPDSSVNVTAPVSGFSN